MERRLRTSFIVRERFERISRMASVAGLVAAAVGVVAVAQLRGFEAAFDSRSFVVGSALSLAAGFVVPRWLARLRWRQIKRRNREEWQ